jgi:hypothetical protein
MYRKPKFLKVLHEIRQEMARDCDYDIDLFIQRLRIEPARPDLESGGFSRISEIKPQRPRSRRAKKEP